MLSFDALVARLRSAEGAGFGVTEPRAGAAVNNAVRQLAALSKWVTEERELASTVADIYLYDLASDIVDVEGIMVGEGTAWQRASTKQLWQYRSGQRQLNMGTSGAFAPSASSDGTKKIALFPTPDETGLSVVGLCSVLTPDFSGTDVPPFPDDHETTILDFAREELYEEIDEDVTTGQYYGNRARAKAETLRRRKNSQIGSGPIQAQIMGVHFS